MICITDESMGALCGAFMWEVHLVIQDLREIIQGKKSNRVLASSCPLSHLKDRQSIFSERIMCFQHSLSIIRSTKLHIRIHLQYLHR